MLITNFSNYVFNDNMRFVIDSNYDPKRYEMLKMFERPLSNLRDDENVEMTIDVMRIVIDSCKNNEDRWKQVKENHQEMAEFIEMFVDDGVDFDEWIKEDY